MTIPESSNYPQAFDTNQNLYFVHDGLRLTLAEDYNPGDTSITIIPGADIMSLFDSSGIITLTEQCSDAPERALSFYYGSRTDTTFDELVLLPNFNDVVKPKNITNITQNVMAEHHNNLKNTVIEIQKFAGKKGQAPIKPLEGTIEQRITYLRNIALAPKAWFKVDKNIGLAPLKVTFTDQSFRLGTDGTSQNLEFLWDFGDNTGPSTITIVEDTEVPSIISNILVDDPDGNNIIKTYTKPGFYTISLTVTNDFGSDTVVFTDMINAKFPAPDFATIDFITRPGQILQVEGSPNGGPYTTPPRIRAAVNTIIDLEIPGAINSPPDINVNTGNTNAGEVIDGSGYPIDPIISYTWDLSDDLTHSNSSKAKAVFSIGGLYDLNLRADTQFGSYRITSYQDCFDIVERVNLWLWTYNNTETAVNATEFGLISETFKVSQTEAYSLNRNSSFISSFVQTISPEPEDIARATREFKRNVGFAQRTTSTSGNNGSGLLYYASGRTALQSPSDERIYLVSYNGFLKTYTNQQNLQRPWNWVSLPSTTKIYFILGGVETTPLANTSPTNQKRDSFDYLSYTFDNTPPTFNITNYLNGAQELLQNEVTYDTNGDPKQGHMSVYRSCWDKNASGTQSVGYFIRNQGVGQFFRLRSFYRTIGDTASEFASIQKLNDMIGSARVEGQIVPLSEGIYFFTNSGAVAAYNTLSGVWSTGGPGVNSAAFRLLQDNTVIDFDAPEQTFLCASDNDRVAYLSFDYSPKAFIKFNEIDTTFSSVTNRPDAGQWNMSIF
jgi:PKD repeat protein